MDLFKECGYTKMEFFDTLFDVLRKTTKAEGYDSENALRIACAIEIINKVSNK